MANAKDSTSLEQIVPLQPVTAKQKYSKTFAIPLPPSKFYLQQSPPTSALLHHNLLGGGSPVQFQAQRASSKDGGGAVSDRNFMKPSKHIQSKQISLDKRQENETTEAPRAIQSMPPKRKFAHSLVNLPRTSPNSSFLHLAAVEQIPMPHFDAVSKHSKKNSACSSSVDSYKVRTTRLKKVRKTASTFLSPSQQSLPQSQGETNTSTHQKA